MGNTKFGPPTHNSVFEGLFRQIHSHIAAIGPPEYNVAEETGYGCP